MKNFRDLQIWQLSYALARRIFELSKGFPAEDRFGFTRDLRESARSVPSNIAEGSRRWSSREFMSFASIASGSNGETINHLLEARDRGCLEPDLANSLISEAEQIGAMLYGFSQSLARQSTHQLARRSDTPRAASTSTNRRQPPPRNLIPPPQSGQPGPG